MIRLGPLGTARLPEPCLCGADDCPRCYPEILDDERRARDEARADYDHQRDQDDLSERDLAKEWGGIE